MTKRTIKNINFFSKFRSRLLFDMKIDPVIASNERKAVLVCVRAIPWLIAIRAMMQVIVWILFFEYKYKLPMHERIKSVER